MLKDKRQAMMAVVLPLLVATLCEPGAAAPAMAVHDAALDLLTKVSTALARTGRPRRGDGGCAPPSLTLASPALPLFFSCFFSAPFLQVGPIYPAAFRGVVQAAPQLKTRLETAIRQRVRGSGSSVGPGAAYASSASSQRR